MRTRGRQLKVKKCIRAGLLIELYLFLVTWFFLTLVMTRLGAKPCWVEPSIMQSSQSAAALTPMTHLHPYYLKHPPLFWLSSPSHHGSGALLHLSKLGSIDKRIHALSSLGTGSTRPKIDPRGIDIMANQAASSLADHDQPKCEQPSATISIPDYHDIPRLLCRSLPVPASLCKVHSNPSVSVLL